MGTAVTCLFGDGRISSAVFATVTSEAPLFLRCDDAELKLATYPRKIVLVWHGEGRFLRGEAEAVALHSTGSETHMEISKVAWEDVERRRYPRIVVRLPVALRAVHDVHGSTVISLFQGTTEDLSIGGSWVRLDQPLEVGSLVEFHARLSDMESVRALGLVARSDRGRSGAGITFLDYVGGARLKLDEFLQTAAA